MMAKRKRPLKTEDDANRFIRAGLRRALNKWLPDWNPLWVRYNDDGSRSIERTGRTLFFEDGTPTVGVPTLVFRPCDVPTLHKRIRSLLSCSICWTNRRQWPAWR